jgi:hypothetical protein
MGSEEESQPERPSVQSVVDALSIAIGQPILLDDAELTPLAYSRQWKVDAVRSESILSRGPSPAVRDVLLAQGIARATDVVRIAADETLAMEERLCMPVREGARILGYVWLLAPGAIGPADLDSVRRAARDIAALLATSTRRVVPDDGELVEALRAGDPATREQAAAAARARHLLAHEPIVLCLIAAASAARTPGNAPDPDLGAVARRAARRLSVGHAVAATVPEGAALVASLGDPVLRTLPRGEVGTWLRAVAGAGVAVGQSAPGMLTALDEAARQAVVALRVARSRPPEAAVAEWSALGADRLVAQLPADVVRDLPERVAHLLREEPVLVETLAAFLDAGGDVKSTAAALSLHRSGLYYRLRRVEELTGLDLAHGDDRLLAHLAIRTERMS